MPSSAQSLLILLAAYLIGSVSGSLLIGRLHGVDIRTQGSGNAGGSNAFRTQGFAFGAGAALFDIAKGALVAWVALRCAPTESRFDATVHAYAAAFAAMIGHVWPLWHGFRGGKGAATLAGSVLVLWPWVTPALVVVWIATMVSSGYVGLATVAAGIALAVIAWFTGAEPARLVFANAAAMLLLFTHRGNLARLQTGGESRFERARLLHRLWRRP
ncbi:MAG: glycerol-3-phosphate 1-O-acyltransferase PlsY [Luteimonas sp.]|nr:glycerol-3-phosphate 1-O-acyltransferase PlsY [Luteimonas sp.]